MINRRRFLTMVAVLGAGGPAAAQFTGPSVQGVASTVSQVASARIGSYITLEGAILSHLREDYYRFSDGTGEIRVEIPQDTFAGQSVGPDSQVRIMGEVDSGSSGRYIWVKTLSVI
ncbi:MAG: NirD/YgiW/YdeI family stress tolerance protein [Pseudomonadota bacterium]